MAPTWHWTPERKVLNDYLDAKWGKWHLFASKWTSLSPLCLILMETFTTELSTTCINTNNVFFDVIGDLIVIEFWGFSLWSLPLLFASGCSCHTHLLAKLLFSSCHDSYWIFSFRFLTSSVPWLCLQHRCCDIWALHPPPCTQLCHFSKCKLGLSHMLY